MGIGSRLAPHLMVYTVWSVNHQRGFILDIRQWWGPLGDLITNLVLASDRIALGDYVNGGLSWAFDQWATNRSALAVDVGHITELVV